VDAGQAREFVRKFTPSCDYLIAHIVWDNQGGMHYVPHEAQKEVFNTLDRTRYFKLPKPGTNPRGVEISIEAMALLVAHGATRTIPIDWRRPEGQYDQYERWVEYWRLD